MRRVRDPEHLRFVTQSVASFAASTRCGHIVDVRIGGCAAANEAWPLDDEPDVITVA